jgi:hypothetical protein
MTGFFKPVIANHKFHAGSRERTALFLRGVVSSHPYIIRIRYIMEHILMAAGRLPIS